MEGGMTENDLLEALRDALKAPTERPEGAHTVREIRAITGQAAETVCDALRRMIESGAVECVQVPQMRIDGRKTRVPAYRVKAA